MSPMGLTIKCAGAGQYIKGSTRIDGATPVEFYDCFFGGPDLEVDMSWLEEVVGLKRVEIRNVCMNGGHYGKADLLHLIEGRDVAVLVGCCVCSLPISGDDGSSDVCPDDLSFRCVLSS